MTKNKQYKVKQGDAGQHWSVQARVKHAGNHTGNNCHKVCNHCSVVFK